VCEVRLLFLTLLCQGTTPQILKPKFPVHASGPKQKLEAAGGKCLSCVVDVRDEKQVRSAVEEAVKKFGGIDILVNNASAISLTGTLDTEMKKFDLMHQVNIRGTFMVSKLCLPYLQKGRNPHILNLSPPLNMNSVWFKNHAAYTMSKYGMSMCVLGMAEELREEGIAVNALWPRTAIHTAAIEMISGRDAGSFSRKPEIMADAAYAILCRDAKTFTGNFTVDDDILKEEGITNLDQYAVDPSSKDNLMLDLFLEVSPDLLKIKQQGSDSGVQGGQLASIFKKIQANLSSELVSKTNAVFHFVVKGSESGDWYIDLKTGKGSAGQGKPPSAADAVLTMDSKDFFDLFSGKLKPTGAYMSGKLKISGNLQKALKLEKLMGMLKSKL